MEIKIKDKTEFDKILFNLFEYKYKNDGDAEKWIYVSPQHKLSFKQKRNKLKTIQMNDFWEWDLNTFKCAKNMDGLIELIKAHHFYYTFGTIDLIGNNSHKKEIER